MNLEKQLKTMNTIFAIAGGLWAVWTVYLIVRNIQHPKVSIKSVDYSKGRAVINIGSREENLFKNSTISAGADWGVRFNGPDSDTIDRIELVNNDLVHEILHIEP
jgi:hypothetical protein